MGFIPIVDLENLPDITENFMESPEWITVAGKVREGLGTVGFLYLINHNINKETVDSVFSLSHKFFDLPLETKMSYKKDTSSAGQSFDKDKYYGYTPLCGETLHPTSKAELKEAFDWLPNEVGKYPTDIFPDFYSTINKLDFECKGLLKKLLRLIAISLKLEDVDFFVKNCRHFEDGIKYDGIYNMRLLLYPPIEDDTVIQPGTVRCGEHSDYGFLTLLFQDDIGGLEIKNVNGEWVHADPIPGSILINVGDLTEFWTGGIFPATPHRLVVPNVEDKRRKHARYSVVFFNGPDVGTVVTPMDLEKTSEELKRISTNGKIYPSKEPINAWDHMMGRIANQYR